MQKLFKQIKEDEIVSIQFTDDEIEMVDIAVDSTDMLFVANGLVTHNCAYQTNDVVLEQVAESAALIHTVDGLFGIIQDEYMYLNGEYFLKALAVRENGFKNSKKRFEVSYDYLRIIEDMNSDIINPIN